MKIPINFKPVVSSYLIRVNIYLSIFTPVYKFEF